MPVITQSRSTRSVVINKPVPVRAIEQQLEAVEVPTPGAAPVVVDNAAQRIVETGMQGPRGPAGPAGAPGGVAPLIDFAYGDASPAAVLALATDSEVLEISLEIEEAFNGLGAAIALGTASDPELLIPFDQNAPGEIAVFEFSPRAGLPAGTELVLTIQPGAGATAGRGQLAIQLVPSN